MAEGFAHSKGVDGDALVDAVVADLPEDLVYAGFSWGVPRAQRLAQTRPGAKGALFYESCIPISGEWAFGPWPDGVPVQIHGMEGDEFFDEDLPAARELVETVGPELAELFVYPGDAHLFTDRSLPAYDAEAAGLVLQRSLAFLDRALGETRPCEDPRAGGGDDRAGRPGDGAARLVVRPRRPLRRETPRCWRPASRSRGG